MKFLMTPAAYGGRKINQKGHKNERIFRGGAKARSSFNILRKIWFNWNISLFHYRNLGSAFGKILIGIEDSNSNKFHLIKHGKTDTIFIEELIKPIKTF